MKKIISLIVLAAILFQGCVSKKKDSKEIQKVKAHQIDETDEELTVAVYYFPNYHTGDPRNTKLKGEDWAEWELVKSASARFPEEHQPNVPAWGYNDEKDPKVMAQKIEAAVSHGIDTFIFDWYMYEDGPFLNRCIDEGFLKAENINDIKFGLMWANHDWVDIHPYTRGEPQKLLYPGKVSPERFEEISSLVIEKYFKQPNYWKIAGKPYFSVYDVQKFVEGFGSMEATKVAMDRMREKAINAGFKGVHWNLVAWGQPILPVEKAPKNTPELIQRLGFDSSTSYVWIHHVELPETKTDYNYVRDEYFKHWDMAKKDYGITYIPNVTMGWNSTPRCAKESEWAPVGYPFMNTIGNNTPENFKTALQMTKDKLLKDPNGPRILNINCWNEWTEGSYLEPDTINGMAYLEAVKSVFKK
ncbi:glycoside hydrolase family 99-like domain-containing protein [Winogradskyella sp.]|uniref:glycosyltransferase WbsX family protein n=1 Tax=Winogradskyella sp. TaxID=1883156 RepID=UPI00351530AF